MKLKLIETENWNGDTIHELYLNDKELVTIYPLTESPEDAIIGRDLISGDEIINFIKMGYEAALRGEELIIE